jgi:hypothetical protein
MVIQKTNRRIASLVTVVAFGSAAESALGQAAGPIADYRFEHNADDASGNGYHGTVHGALQYADGISGAAALFDGATTSVDIGAEPNFPVWEDYTVAVWINENGTGDYSRGYGPKIVDKTQVFHAWWLGVYPYTGYDGAILWRTDEYPTYPKFVLRTQGHDYRDSRWHHIACVKAGNWGGLYIDGELVESAYGIRPVASGTPLVIGYSRSGDAYQRKHFGGRIDELRIYERALLSSEVWALADTDGDGITDGDELEMAMGTGCPCPSDPDSDDDTLGDGHEVDIGTDPCNTDTDGDGVPDNLDPDPLDPQGTGSWIEEELRALRGYIAGVDEGLFTAPNINANRGRRNALSNRANAAANEVAGEKYTEAIDALESLLQFVDGHQSAPDWIQACEERDHIVSCVIEMITVLEYLR